MKTLLIVLLVTTNSVFAWEWPRSKITIEKTNNVMKIDGIDDEDVWKNTKEIPIAYDLTGCEDKTAMKASFKMIYDNNNIYIFCTVHDATPFYTVKGEYYNSDCFWMYFSMDTTFNITTDSGSQRAVFYPGFWEILKIATPDSAIGTNGPPALWVMGGRPDGNINWIDTSFFESPGFKVVQVEQDTSYYQEWQFPISKLDPDRIFNGVCFKFDIKVSDRSDKDSTSYVCSWHWNSEGDNFGSNQTFGFVYLKEPFTSIRNSAIAVPDIQFELQSVKFSKSCDVSIYDITGVVIKNSRNARSISIESLKHGIYFIKYGNEVKKFVK
jgi:hypothetical protein